MKKYDRIYVLFHNMWQQFQEHADLDKDGIITEEEWVRVQLMFYCAGSMLGQRGTNLQSVENGIWETWYRSSAGPLLASNGQR